MKVPLRSQTRSHPRTVPLRKLQTRYRDLRLTVEHHRGPLTAVALSIRAGARFDGRHPGLAHAAEHMLFQRTRNLDYRRLTELAADLGGHHNAVTRYETITLIIECFNEDVEKALWLLSEQYYHAAIEEERWEVERRVVMDELRGFESDPVQLLEETAFCRFFRGALAHPIAGTARSLKKLSAQHIRDFLGQHFVHGATSLGVAGGIEPDRILKLAEKFFCGGPKPIPKPPPVEPGRVVVLRRHEQGTVGYVTLLLEAPAAPRDFFAAAVALEVLGDGPDTRLFQEIRGRLGLGYTVDTGSMWGPDWAVFVIGASCPPDQVKLLRKTIESICADAAAWGFDKSEIERARKKLKFNYALLGNSLFDRAIALAEDCVLGFPLPEEAEDMISGFTDEEVEDAWRQVWLGRKLAALLT
ncbi:MAG: insulinase family protein [Candidatus Binatia bacterium]|nr:insulinase family protein [Candidatus Binatia bacterium]